MTVRGLSHRGEPPSRSPRLLAVVKPVYLGEDGPVFEKELLGHVFLALFYVDYSLVVFDVRDGWVSLGSSTRLHTPLGLPGTSGGPSRTFPGDSTPLLC